MSRGFSTALAGFWLAGAVLAPDAAQAAVPSAPTRWVTDQAGFLSEGARATLDARLEDYQRQTGHHLLVWIDKTTDGIPVEDFSVHAFEAWRVGRKGIDDGLVLFVLSEDRKVRIEVGYGLEAQVPDAIASRVIREEIVPRIRAGDRDGAIQTGVEALVAAVEGRASPVQPGREGTTAEPDRPLRGTRPLSTAQKVLVGLVALAFLILFITNPSLAIYLLFSALSSGRGGFGGSGGGGGYSGGGGRSGGGGATGSW